MSTPGVAGVDRRGDEHPLGMIEADERKLQEPAEALLGAQIRVVAPGDVGERADGDAQARIGWPLPGEEIRGPADQRGREIGHARQRQADELRAFDQRVEIALRLAQLRIEQAFAQAERGEHHPLGREPLQHAIEHERGGRQGARAPLRHAGSRGQPGRRQPQQRFCEAARFRRSQRVAVDHLDRRPGRLHMRLGQRAPAAADRIEHRPAERRGQILPQDRIDPAPGFGPPVGEHRFDRQGAERHADPAIADMVVERLGDFEAAAAHVADRPDRAEEAGDHAERGQSRFLGAAEDADLETRFGGNGGGERRPVRRPPDRFGCRRIDPGHAHRIGDRAKPPHRLDRAPKPLGRDRAGLREAFAQPAQRLLIEARQRRAAELLIDDEPHR
ncbi:MAG: hypothetical protein ABSG83_16200, partial [Roseiarcus sp.]